MPPKRAPTAIPTSSTSRSSAAARSAGPPSARQPESGTVGSALRNTYDALTAQENRSVLKAVGFAGVAVAFFSSSWSEYLHPPA